MARIGIGVRFYALDDLAGPRDLVLKGGNAGLLTFVGEARTGPAKRTGGHHRIGFSIVNVAGSGSIGARTFPDSKTVSGRNQ
jgi:hypothetical protein